MLPRCMLMSMFWSSCLQQVANTKAGLYHLKCTSHDKASGVCGQLVFFLVLAFYRAPSTGRRTNVKQSQRHRRLRGGRALAVYRTSRDGAGATACPLAPPVPSAYAAGGWTGEGSSEVLHRPRRLCRRGCTGRWTGKRGCRRDAGGRPQRLSRGCAAAAAAPAGRERSTCGWRELLHFSLRRCFWRV